MTFRTSVIDDLDCVAAVLVREDALKRRVAVLSEFLYFQGSVS